MKKIAFTLTLAALSFAALAQEPATPSTDAQAVAAEAAAAAEAAPEVPKPAPKPQYWVFSLQNNINFGQTYLHQWSAGGFNTVSLAAGIDGSANYAKDKMVWNNRLQLDYGFLYSADKPLLQKHKDRIYFESKWGLETPAPHLSYSANFDLRTQFHNNYDYPTPKGDFTDREPTRDEWKSARIIKSGFLSPLYVNLGLGLLWTPKKWFSLNFAPLTGGAVLVMNDELRYTYGMDLKKDSGFRYEGRQEEEPDVDVTKGRATEESRKLAYGAEAFSDFRPIRYEFGAQLKADVKWEINDNFKYTSQLAVFYNYLTPKIEPRVIWDQKVFWKLAKYFAVTLSTNMIYDPLVIVRDRYDDTVYPRVKGKDRVPDSKGIQFKEFLEIGFTYTLSSKK